MTRMANFTSKMYNLCSTTSLQYYIFVEAQKILLKEYNICYMLKLFLSNKSVQTRLIQKVRKSFPLAFPASSKRETRVSLLFSRILWHQGNLPLADLIRWRHQEEIYHSGI
jgi:hypothetical protein